MFKKILLTLFIVVLCTSCKENEEKGDQKNKDNQTIDETNSQKKSFGVLISFKTNKTDKIKVTMNGIKVDEFQKKNISFVEDVEATTEMDKIVVDFGGGNFARNIGVNLGQLDNKTIDIDKMIFTYGYKKVEVNRQNYDKYLRHNIFVKRDSLTNRFTVQKVANKSFYPLIYLRQSLFNELIKQ